MALPSISPNQQKQYGDETVLQKMRTATKPLPISGAPVPTRGAGRPPGSKQQTPTAAAPQGAAVEIPQEHLDLMDQTARRVRTLQAWQQMAARPDAGPWVRMNLEAAQTLADEGAAELYDATPNFEG